MAVFSCRLPPASASQRWIHALSLVDALQQGGDSAGEEAPQWLRHSRSLNEAGEAQATMIVEKWKQIRGENDLRGGENQKWITSTSTCPNVSCHWTGWGSRPPRYVPSPRPSSFPSLISSSLSLSQKHTQSLFQPEMQGDLKLVSDWQRWVQLLYRRLSGWEGEAWGAPPLLYISDGATILEGSTHCEPFRIDSENETWAFVLLYDVMVFFSNPPALF